MLSSAVIPRSRFALRRLQAHFFHEHLKIFPHFSLRFGSSKQVRRVVRDDRRDALVVVPLSAGSAHRRGQLFKRPCSATLPSRQINSGRMMAICFFEVSDAVVGFFERRRAVFGRTALEHVGDVDLVAAEAHALGDHVGQELAGAADERLALTVFVGARGLADEHQPGLGRPGAENCLGARLGQVSTLAALATTEASDSSKAGRSHAGTGGVSNPGSLKSGPRASSAVRRPEARRTVEACRRRRLRKIGCERAIGPIVRGGRTPDCRPRGACRSCAVSFAPGLL